MEGIRQQKDLPKNHPFRAAVHPAKEAHKQPLPLSAYLTSEIFPVTLQVMSSHLMSRHVVPASAPRTADTCLYVSDPTPVPRVRRRRRPKTPTSRPDGSLHPSETDTSRKSQPAIQPKPQKPRRRRTRTMRCNPTLVSGPGREEPN
jgi:hypothetical protein